LRLKATVAIQTLGYPTQKPQFLSHSDAYFRVIFTDYICAGDPYSGSS
jgi:hypothetical protein